MSKNKHSADVAGELKKLSAVVGKALKAASESSHISGVKKDLQSSVRKIGGRLTNAITDARKSEEAQALESQARRVLSASKSQAKQSSKKLRADLAVGMKALAGELAKLADKVAKS